MGNMHRPAPGDEPALKTEDLVLEESFEAYVDSHSYTDRQGLRAPLPRTSFESAYRRRRAWFAWFKGWTAEQVDEYLKPLARNAMRECPAASRGQAYAFASKQVVAIVHMTRGSEGRAALWPGTTRPPSRCVAPCWRSRCAVAGARPWWPRGASMRRWWARRRLRP